MYARYEEEKRARERLEREKEEREYRHDPRDDDEPRRDAHHRKEAPQHHEASPKSESSKKVRATPASQRGQEKLTHPTLTGPLLVCVWLVG